MTKKETSRLKRKIKEQEKVIRQYKDMNVSLPSIEAIRAKSRHLIHQFVEEMLEDDNINIKSIPNCLEQRIYENILTILITIIEKVLDHSNIELLNHKIIFHVMPKE